MTDFRALCAELVDSVELLLEMRPVKAKPLTITEGRLSRARTLLAQPEPEGLSEDEDAEAAAQRIYEAMRFERVETTPAWAERGNSFAQDAAREAARAVLNRRPTPQPPVDGEAAELVKWLRKTGKLLHPDYSSSQVPYMRCAELLQRQHPQPVPVSKRLPGAKDCDNRGRCWTTDHDPSLVYSPVWKMTELPRQDLGHDFSNAYFWRNVRFWLPAHALPMPASEEASSG